MNLLICPPHHLAFLTNSPPSHHSLCIHDELSACMSPNNSLDWSCLNSANFATSIVWKYDAPRLFAWALIDDMYNYCHENVLHPDTHYVVANSGVGTINTNLNKWKLEFILIIKTYTKMWDQHSFIPHKMKYLLKKKLYNSKSLILDWLFPSLDVVALSLANNLCFLLTNWKFRLMNYVGCMSLFC